MRNDLKIKAIPVSSSADIDNLTADIETRPIGKEFTIHTFGTYLTTRRMLRNNQYVYEAFIGTDERAVEQTSDINKFNKIVDALLTSMCHAHLYTISTN